VGSAGAGDLLGEPLRWLLQAWPLEQQYLSEVYRMKF
jgi:hypothetical protein